MLPLYNHPFPESRKSPDHHASGADQSADVFGGSDIVFEAGMPTGSTQDGSNSTSGTLTIDAASHLLRTFTLSSGSTTLTLTQDQLKASASQPIVLHTDKGDFVINGYTETGVNTITLHYTYTVSTSYDHALARGNNEVVDPISMTVTGLDGISKSAVFTVTIVDDVPTAVADVNDVTEDAGGNPTTVISGNVYPNDVSGADNPSPVTEVSSNNTGNTGTIGVDFSGAYGTLKLNNDGSYIYTLDNTNVHVQHITTGETLTETFTYSITDADGDASHTTLTITIHGTGDAPVITPVNGIVYEEALPTGSNPSSPNESTTATIDIQAKDGLDHIVIAGQTITESQLLNATVTNPVIVTTSYGVISITKFDPVDPTHHEGSGTVHYTYLLTANTTDHIHSDPNTDTEIIDAIPLEIIDRPGNRSTGTLEITIHDDVPTAKADTNSVTEDTSLTATGNVVTQNDVIGADATATPVIAIHSNNTNTDGSIGNVLVGQYGSLILNNNGAYSYTLNNNNSDVNALHDGETLTETYTYTITDADGDTSSTTLTLTINGTNDMPIAIDHSDVYHEDPIVAGQVPGKTNLLTGASDPDDPSSSLIVGEVNGNAANVGSAVAVNFSYIDKDGNTISTNVDVTVLQDGSYTIAQKNLDAMPENITGAGSLKYRVEDPHGGLSAEHTLDITITGDNDAPVIDSITHITRTEEQLDGYPNYGPKWEGDVYTIITQAEMLQHLGISDVDSTHFTVHLAGVLPPQWHEGLQSDNSNFADNATPQQALISTSSVYDETVIEITQGFLNHYPDVATAGAKVGDFYFDHVDFDRLIPGDIATIEFDVIVNDGANLNSDSNVQRMVVKVTGTDDVVTISIPDQTVYEKGLSPDGSSSGDGSDTVTASFTFNAPDAIFGTGKVTFEGNGNGSAVSFSEAQLLTASASTPLSVDTGEGTLTIIAYSTTAGTGLAKIDYTYTLKDNLDHDKSAGHDTNLTDAIKITVTDRDGSEASDILEITIVDDVPTIKVDTTQVTETTLEVDETDLTINKTDSFANSFATALVVGADGQASFTEIYTLGVVSAGTDSGLIDVASGDRVLLRMDGNVVEGYRENATAELVFTVTAANNGDVTLDQIRALTHPTNPNPDEAISITSDNLITLTKTVIVVDNDGDSATDTASIDIASNLSFKDDGPTASTTINTTASAELDESDFTTAPLGQDVATIAAGSITGLFNSDSSYGADGAGSITYSLDAPVTVTGLYLTGTTTNPIELVAVTTGGVITGYEGKSGTTVAFSITIDNATGEITVTQNETLDHPDTADHNDPVDINGLISVVQTVTDRDGDSVTTTSANGLDISFRDDGPTVTVDTTTGTESTLQVDETDYTQNATSNFANSFVNTTTDAGADGQASLTEKYILDVSAANVDSGLVDTATTTAVLLSKNTTTGAIEGKTSGGVLVFTLTTDNSGNVTLDQSRAVVHSDTSNPNDVSQTITDNLIILTKEVTIVDNDGDSKSDTATINIGSNISFLDDGPAITVTTSTPAADTLTVDESTLGTDATADFADNFTSVPTYGADGAGSVTSAYSLAVSAGATGLVDTATGDSVVLVMNGSNVKGQNSAGDVVFILSVDASGTVTLDQRRAVVHADGSNPNDTVSMISDLITLSREDTITDEDGDSTKASSDIKLGTNLVFTDDAPKASTSTGNTAAAIVDETDFPTGTVGEDSATIAAADITGLFNSDSSYGADGAGSITYALNATNVNTGLFLTSDPTHTTEIVLTQTATGYEGKAGATVAFSVVVDSTSGEIIVTQNETLDHPVTTDSDDAVNINGLISVVQTVTDRDGDSVTTTSANGLDISFRDDGPTAVADTNTIIEDAIPNNVTGNVVTGTGKDTIGADETMTPVTAISSTNQGTNGTIGTPLDGQYGTLTLNDDGSYNYILDNTKSEVQSIGKGEHKDEVFTYTITDADGDTSTATLTIAVNGTNDIPTAADVRDAYNEDKIVLDDKDSNPNDNKIDGLTNLLANAHDIDATDTLHVATVNGQAVGVGTPVTVAVAFTYHDKDNILVNETVDVTVKSDGSYSIAQKDLDRMPIGKVGTGTLTYTIKDQHGASTGDKTLTIDITGDNDAPDAVDDSINIKPTDTIDVITHHVDVTPDHAAINVGHSTDFNLLTAFTISQTITPDSNGIIFNKEGSYEVAIQNGKIQYALQGTSGSWYWIDTGYAPIPGKEQTITAVYDGAHQQFTVYVDGQEVYDKTGGLPSQLRPHPNQDLLFGERGINNQGIKGTFDNIVIYDKVLTDAEISDLANGILAGGEVAHYDFETSTPLVDKSTHNHTATLESGATVVEVTAHPREDTPFTFKDINFLLSNDSDIDSNSFSLISVQGANTRYREFRCRWKYLFCSRQGL